MKLQNKLGKTRQISNSCRHKNRNSILPYFIQWTLDLGGKVNCCSAYWLVSSDNILNDVIIKKKLANSKELRTYSICNFYRIICTGIYTINFYSHNHIHFQ